MRNACFDVCKFLVMLMVIFGHFTGKGVVENGMPDWYGCFNVGLSMPLFFIVSGFFSMNSLKKKPLPRIVSFIWPLASFGLVFGLILLLFGLIPVWKALLYPIARVVCGSWFLVTLALVYGINAIVWKTFKKDASRLSALCLVYVCSFFMAGLGGAFSLLRISNVLDMLPYFVFGLYFLRKYEFYKKLYVGVLCGLFYMAVVLLEGNITTNGMGFYWVSKDWHVVINDRHLLFCFFARTFVGIAGTIFLLWIVEMILKLIPRLSCLAVFGSTTLGIYVMHEWPLVQIKKYFNFEPLGVWWGWGLTLMMFLTCHFLTLFIKARKSLRVFFFGDESNVSRILEVCLKKK